MSRRGSALLLALWLAVALTVLTGTVLAMVRLDATASRNRMLLTRAAWAREACAAILHVRFDPAAPLRPLDSVDLGHGAWCRATVHDPAERLNINLASDEQVKALLANDSVADAVLDWRDKDTLARPHGAEATYYRSQALPPPRNGSFAAVEELRYVRGIRDSDIPMLEGLLTVHGAGRINAARAPEQVLATLPGFTLQDARVVAEGRAPGSALSLGRLLDLLPAERATALLARGPELQAAVTFTAEELVVQVSGRIGGSPLVAQSELLAVPTPTRLAIVRRIVW